MRCVLLAVILLVGSFLAMPSANAVDQEKDTPKKPHVVFITGDCEYRSEVSMPMIAKILEGRHGMKCSVCFAKNEKGELVTKYLKNIDGLEAVKSADLVVMFTRYRQLPDDQLKIIIDYANSGKPIIGLRTTTHAFRYESAPNNQYNDGFGKEVFGQKWISHHGHDSSTNVTVTDFDHPIMRGLEPKFHCRSWLYHVTPLIGECHPLAIGDAVKGEKETDKTFGQQNPVAWTKMHKGGRVFFTTLGHPQDFENVNVRRLLVNGIYWALGMEGRIPEKGTNVDFVGEYVAPPTTMAIPDPIQIGAR